MKNNKYVLLKEKDNGYYFVREDGTDKTDIFYDKHTGFIILSSLETTYDPTTEEMHCLLMNLIVCPLPNLPQGFGSDDDRLLNEQFLIKKLMDLKLSLEVSLVMDTLVSIPTVVVTQKGEEIYANIYYIDQHGHGHRSRNLYSKDQAHCWVDRNVDIYSFDLVEIESLRREIDETGPALPNCSENDLVRYN